LTRRALLAALAVAPLALAGCAAPQASRLRSAIESGADRPRGLPAFAAPVEVHATPFTELRTPALRIRLGGMSTAEEAEVGRLAEAIAAIRPQLLRQGEWTI